DRQQRELARSIQTVSLFVDPDGLQPGDLQCTASELAKTLGEKESDLLKELADAQKQNHRFVWVARRLDVEQTNRILSMNLPGLNSVLEPKRYYPNGSLAAHALGFVGLDGQGLGGLEQSYNAKISGEPGRLFLKKDATGKPYESFEIAAKQGQTVVLTIDQAIQYQAERALQSAVER